MVLYIVVVTACAPDGFVCVCTVCVWHGERSFARRNLSCIKILSDVGAVAAAAAVIVVVFSLFTYNNRFSLSFCILCADCCAICM